MRIFVLVFAVAYNFIGNDAQKEGRMADLTAKLLVLPPLVVGYEELVRTTTTSPEKYTLKFDGNFELPRKLVAELNWNEPDKSNGLQQLVQLGLLQRMLQGSANSGNRNLKYRPVL